MKIFIFLALFLYIFAVDAVILKDPITVVDKNITLGDVFDGVCQQEQEIIQRAPLPSQKAVLKADDIKALLIKYRLEMAQTPRDIIIYRKSYSLVQHEIEKLLYESLQQSDPANEWKIILDQPNIRIETPLNAANAPFIERIELDIPHERFDATLIVYDDDQQPLPHRIVGRLLKVVTIPVLKHPLGPGDIIKREDIDWHKMRADKIRNNVVLTADRLVGMTPRLRLIKPQEAIRIEDLTTPKAIRKGMEVSLVLRAPAFVLVQRKAQALEDGAVGDRIKICNLSSKRIVIGTVKDAGTVEVNLAQ